MKLSSSMHFAGFPFFGIWSRKDEAPIICLEPWYGVADSKDSNGVFEEKVGINKLEPKEEFECSYVIEVN